MNRRRIRAISKATELEDRVFTTVNGKPAKSLYVSLIADLLDKATLREGTQGVPRSTDCFRHTYATLRLQKGVDVYFLAEQMGTSVQIIEQHYGYVDTVTCVSVPSFKADPKSDYGATLTALFKYLPPFVGSLGLLDVDSAAQKSVWQTIVCRLPRTAF